MIAPLNSRHLSAAQAALRIAAGLAYFAHDVQKLFGWFGGMGPRGATLRLARGATLRLARGAVAALLVVAPVAPNALSAQVGERPALGPKDGAGLAPLDTGRVIAGLIAPDFTLEAKDGGTVTLSQFRGKKNVVLVFYRGHW